jgi:hypothetical protein
LLLLLLHACANACQVGGVGPRHRHHPQLPLLHGLLLLQLREDMGMDVCKVAGRDPTPHGRHATCQLRCC